jgi:hypothetical protein
MDYQLYVMLYTAYIVIISTLHPFLFNNVIVVVFVLIHNQVKSSLFKDIIKIFDLNEFSYIIIFYLCHRV